MEDRDLVVGVRRLCMAGRLCVSSQASICCAGYVCAEQSGLSTGLFTILKKYSNTFYFHAKIPSKFILSVY